MEIAKKNYDPRHGILYLNVGKQSAESLAIGNFVVDIGEDGSVVGLEIMNAPETLSEMSNRDIDATMLEQLQDADITLLERGATLFIVLTLTLQQGGTVVEESIDLNIPAETAVRG